MTIILPAAGLGAPQRRSPLLFHWRAADLSLRALSGQLGVFTRASRGVAYDSPGVLYSAAHSAARWHVLNGEVGLLLEGARSNLLLHSQEFNDAAWVKLNITVSQDVATAPNGSLTADKVAATATAGTQMTQLATMTGVTSAAVSFWAKRGSGDTVANRFALRNSTTSTWLSQATLNYATGVLTLATGNGFVESRGNGWYCVTLYATAGITAGDAIIGYGPFDSSPATAGDFAYLWGGQIAASPTSYIPTQGAVVTRAADDIAFPFSAVPQSLTVYERHVDLGSQLTGNASLYELGTWGAPPALTAYHPTATTIGALYHNGTVQATTGTVASGIVIGDVVETAVTLTVDPVTNTVVTGFSVARNGAAAVVVAPAAAIALASVFQGQTLRLNSRAGTAVGFAAFRSLKIAGGARTLAQMQAAY